jgi:predicted  nucleic acid-binding Zn-ribbon protein
MRSDLRKVEDMVAREKAELEETERWRREQEAEVKSESEQLAKAKAKASQVKNAKEFGASQRELETTRRLAQETEEKLAKVVEAADAARGRITAHEGDVERLRELVEREAAASEGKLAGLDGEITEARQKREEAAKTVRPDVIKRYNAIRMRRGLAVVPVKAGTCSGCHMNIPPQLFNTLQRGNSLELCPSCHRIIYWDKIMENPDGRPSEPPTDPEPRA